MEKKFNVSAIEDALRRRDPDALRDISKRFPKLGISEDLERPLGDVEIDYEGIHEFAELAVNQAQAELSELNTHLSLKLRSLARIRFGAAIASAVSSASVVALILGNENGQIVAASVAFISTLVSLFLVYFEEFSGGVGSLKKLHDRMAEETRKLATLSGDLRLSKILGDEDSIVEVVQKTNAIFGEAQFVRATVGMQI